MNTNTYQNHRPEKCGYEVSRFPLPTKRFCRTLELKDDPNLIEEYKRIHSEKYYWPEIGEGIRSVGILAMEIFLCDTLLVMIVETAVDFDWDCAFEKLENMPQQVEWEKYTSKFQVVSNKSNTPKKWRLMERIFKLP